ncbi:MAG TPA: ribonuclease HII [Parcubacteria group bacterium]|nr:ribonuclease HII [Parcubacteria group bacterium]
MTDIIGIDEAGRGPLAGPVAVGVAKICHDFDMSFFEGIKDSKKLTEKGRKEWFAKAEEMKREGKLNFTVELVGADVIDKRGIVYAIKLGMSKCMKRLGVDEDAKIFLDGSLHAPKEFKNQETIIKGDEKIALISLASICAKVARDQYMTKLATEYPEYKFDIHKGYGTKAHIEAIKKHGSSAVHRMSFLKNILKA